MKPETATPIYSQADLRAELIKLLPGYKWTVHKGNPSHLNATGIQTSGFNRTSTLMVARRDTGKPWYEISGFGFGLRSACFGKGNGATLAKAVRGLQDHYKWNAGNYATLERTLEDARKPRKAQP